MSRKRSTPPPRMTTRQVEEIRYRNAASRLGLDQVPAELPPCPYSPEWLNQLCNCSDDWTRRECERRFRNDVQKSGGESERLESRPEHTPEGEQ